MLQDELRHFKYQFDKGPLILRDLKRDEFKEGNCRLALQYYFYKIHKKFYKSELLLNPREFNKVGKFIINEGDFNKDSLNLIREGDIIYADKIRKEDIDIDRKNWIIRLHTAIYCGDNKIYHSSLIDYGSNFWTFNKFIKYYKPIAVKRVLE